MKLHIKIWYRYLNLFLCSDEITYQNLVSISRLVYLLRWNYISKSRIDISTCFSAQMKLRVTIWYRYLDLFSVQMKLHITTSYRYLDLFFWSDKNTYHILVSISRLVFLVRWNYISQSDIDISTCFSGQMKSICVSGVLFFCAATQHGNSLYNTKSYALSTWIPDLKILPYFIMCGLVKLTSLYCVWQYTWLVSMYAMRLVRRMRYWTNCISIWWSVLLYCLCNCWLLVILSSVSYSSEPSVLKTIVTAEDTVTDEWRIGNNLKWSGCGLLKRLPWHSPGGTMRNYKTPQSRLSVCLPKWENYPSRIHVLFI
jgi:hypothetical protein